MRAINVLLSVSISLILAFVVFEFGLRLFPNFRPQEPINEFHPVLGWAKRPHAEVGRSTSEFDITFEINDQGLRCEERTSVAKSPNTFRVMMLGDSFVLGYTVDRKDLFVDHLRHYWSSEERRVDVVNAGTEGYSTDQSVLWFDEFGKAYQPDVVLLFPYENDIYWNGQDHYNRYPKPRYGPDGKLETGKLEDPGQLPWVTRKLATAKLLGLFVQGLSKPKGPPPHFFQPEGASGYVANEFAPLLLDPPAFVADTVARTEGALEALKTSCAEIGARLIVVPIPSESAIHADEKAAFQKNHLKGLDASRWSPDRPVELFLDLAKKHGIETLDVRSTFHARAGLGERLYFEQEWHFNPDGNLALAEFLKDELDARSVFPKEHAALAAGTFEKPATGGGLPTWILVFGALWLALGGGYIATYRDESAPLSFLKVGGLLACIFTIVLGGNSLVQKLPPALGPWLVLTVVTGILGFVVFKMGRRVGTIFELLTAFTLRGHWYLMPLVVVLLTIGSLLVVAASSPLVAPFIYTLF